MFVHDHRRPKEKVVFKFVDGTLIDVSGTDLPPLTTDQIGLGLTPEEFGEWVGRINERAYEKA